MEATEDDKHRKHGHSKSDLRKPCGHGKWNRKTHYVSSSALNRRQGQALREIRMEYLKTV